ncbi:MAG: DUF6570 domain-containing protein, partial [Pseudomonadota bacterium]|nr:DUF6570 domain-containing protein [Pseudomonadota bacterium]
MQKRRLSQDYRTKEKLTERKGKLERRSSESKRFVERQKEKENVIKRRLSQDYRMKEKLTERKGKLERRSSENKRSVERQKQKETMQKRRLSQEYRMKEKLTERKGKLRRRSDLEYCRSEAEKLRLARKKRRNDPFVKRMEALHAKAYMRNKRRTNKKKRFLVPAFDIFSETKKTFQSCINHGPSFVCTCCNGMFYKHSVSLAPSAVRLEQKGIKRALIERCLLGTKSFQDAEWICSTCLRNLSNNVLPDLAVTNGLRFPAVPPPLQGLTTLEERCIAPRIPFMQLRELGVDRQYGIRGNVVNVPVDVMATVTSLPRRFEETQTIALKLQRRMCYKSSYHFENVRPRKIFDAAKWLIEHSEMYKEDKITLDPTWYQEDWQGK